MNQNNALSEIADWVRANPHETGGDIYHPLPFEELRSLKSSSDPEASFRKWSLMVQALPKRQALRELKVLDVGANAGFFSFSFAKEGAKVIAFEPHAYYVEVGRKIVDVTGLTVEWNPRPLDTPDLIDKSFDVALMLSVFQWISDGNEKLEHACKVLEAVAASSRYLFFELGCNSGKSAIEVKGSPLLWIWRLLEKHTAPKQIYYLGTARAWGKAKRYLFLCTAERPSLTLWQVLASRVLRLCSTSPSER